MIAMLYRLIRQPSMLVPETFEDVYDFEVASKLTSPGSRSCLEVKGICLVISA